MRCDGNRYFGSREGLVEHKPSLRNRNGNTERHLPPWVSLVSSILVVSKQETQLLSFAAAVAIEMLSLGCRGTTQKPISLAVQFGFPPLKAWEFRGKALPCSLSRAKNVGARNQRKMGHQSSTRQAEPSFSSASLTPSQGVLTASGIYIGSS